MASSKISGILFRVVMIAITLYALFFKDYPYQEGIEEVLVAWAWVGSGFMIVALIEYSRIYAALDSLKSGDITLDDFRAKFKSFASGDNIPTKFSRCMGLLTILLLFVYLVTVSHGTLALIYLLLSLLLIGLINSSRTKYATYLLDASKK